MRTRKKFLAFLSHHKRDCGVAAQLIKSDLMKTLGKRVYLDSDELEHLDTLLATVRFDVRFFVLLLTQETRWRPWCAGEIVTAKKAKVPFVLVKFDDFVPPGTDDCTEEALCRRFQGSAESGVIPDVGVKMADLSTTYSALPWDDAIQYWRLRPFEQESLASPGDMTVSWDHMMRGLRAKLMPGLSLRRAARATLLRATAPKRSRPRYVHVAVVGSCDAGHAVSTVLLHARCLQEATQKSAYPILHHSVVEWVSEGLLHESPDFIFVALTPGCLNSENFARTYLAAVREWPDAVIIPTVSDFFAFPSSPSLEGSAPSFVSSLSSDEVFVREAYEVLKSTIAVPFSPQGHTNILESEVLRLCEKMEKADWLKRVGRSG